MRRIVRHRKYQAERNKLARKYPDISGHLDEFEQRLASDPTWPASIYLPAYDCWWPHFLVDDESIPHLRVFHAFDDQEVRLLGIVSVDLGLN